MNLLKTCSRCKLSLPTESCFHKASRNKFGFDHRCILCTKRINKEYKDKHKGRLNAEQRESYNQNREKHIQRSRDWYAANSEYAKRRSVERSKRLRKTSTQFKLSATLRGRINQAIKSDRRPGSAVKDLGCTLGELKLYLESKFQEGMTWENHGRCGWHIDHIKPLASFNLSNPTQFKAAIHFTNLQPLWARDNLRKNKYEGAA